MYIYIYVYICIYICMYIYIYSGGVIVQFYLSCNADKAPS